MYSAVENMINQIDTWVWGWWMILLLLGTHIFMTIRTGVIQRKIGTAIRLSVTKDPDGEGEVSQFGALTTALASTIGTGNIIGVGTAIALGGPGAVLWCWLTGVFGIATKYSESLIAVKYRVKTKDGRMQGGAMYALERGLNMKWLGMIFAVFGGFASFGIGCATQVNAIATVCQENLSIPPFVVGIVVAVLTALVIFGADWSGATGRNISGTSDLAPIEEQEAMLKELFPDVKQVGLLYCSAEANSLYQIQLFEAALDKDGIAYKEYAIADTNEVQSVTTAAAGECDVLYIPTDNTLASVTETVYNVVAPAKVPVIAGEEGICNGCGVATLSISYYDLGYATGEMAYEILAEGADITTMDVRYAPNVTKKYNAKICEELGITVPDDYVAIQ